MKPSPYQFQKELTLVLTQKIGNLTWEVEARASEDKAEVTARDESGQLEVMESVELYELESMADFFRLAHEETVKLKSKEIAK